MPKSYYYLNVIFLRANILLMINNDDIHIWVISASPHDA